MHALFGVNRYGQMLFGRNRGTYSVSSKRKFNYLDYTTNCMLAKVLRTSNVCGCTIKHRRHLQRLKINLPRYLSYEDDEQPVSIMFYLKEISRSYAADIYNKILSERLHCQQIFLIISEDFYYKFVAFRIYEN